MILHEIVESQEKMRAHSCPPPLSAWVLTASAHVARGAGIRVSTSAGHYWRRPELCGGGVWEVSCGAGFAFSRPGTQPTQNVRVSEAWSVLFFCTPIGVKPEIGCFRSCRPILSQVLTTL